eukprot:gb/GEZN01006288.1/.p1 GENE.gb/GEZN01006288.1/~~gb/GEZN01006288.1/.p1  ORF type:complete len:530 (+),score=15.22 gb/GEZN01006288.1/:23-1612(+)
MTSDDPTIGEEEYVVSLLIPAIVCACIALVVFLWCACFTCFKCCPKKCLQCILPRCCTTRSCGCKIRNSEDFSRVEKLGYTTLWLSIWIICLSLLAFSIKENVTVSTLSLKIVGFIKNTTVEINMQTLGIQRTFAKIDMLPPQAASLNQSIDQLVKLTNKGVKIGDTASKAGVTVTRIRRAAVIIYMLILGLSLIASLFAMVLKAWPFRYLATYALFIAIIFAYISAAVYLTGGKASKDSCVYIHDIMARQNSTTVKSQPLKLLFTCLEQGDYNISVQLTGVALHNLLADINTQLSLAGVPVRIQDQLPSVVSAVFPDHILLQNQTELLPSSNETLYETYVKWNAFVTEQLVLVNETISSCTQCPPAVTEKVNLIVSNIGLLLTLLDLVVALVNCLYVTYLITHLNFLVCESNLDGALNAVGGISIAHGVMMIPLLALTNLLMFSMFRVQEKSFHTKSQHQIFPDQASSPHGISLAPPDLTPSDGKAYDCYPSPVTEATIPSSASATTSVGTADLANFRTTPGGMRTGS